MILVVGDANADLGAALARFPREGEDHPLRGLTWDSGGSGANVATALALLGARARLLGRVGSDPAAEVALQAARAAGVDLGAVQRDEAVATGLCFAAVSPGGERTFFSHRGANACLAPPPLDALFREVSWLHVAGHALLEGRQREVTLDLIAEARRRAVGVSLDLCLPLLAARPESVHALGQQLALLFANEPEQHALAASASTSAASTSAAPDLLGAALSAIAAAGVPLVAAKLGARGSLIAGPGPARTRIAPFVVEARDTTGSGDAYVAAFLAAFLQGAPPEIAGRLGNAAGALAATRPGAAGALPDRAALQKLLATRTPEDDPVRRLVAPAAPPAAPPAASHEGSP
ncbi:sugar kinase [Chondromyces apiculatus DSM 436]|uniref:Sugar kinase n=1 Tax=Chondromyces apiculatus DSM 436 TaxID=1192034 RepID=A0A017TGW5_9BACT|nr:sugar kinase [Chondromyces apiculatus DSM 436]